MANPDAETRKSETFRTKSTKRRSNHTVNPSRKVEKQYLGVNGIEGDRRSGGGIG